MLNGKFLLIGKSAMTFSEVINTGDSLNQIHAVCQGERLALVVNGIKLEEVQDATIRFGDVGLIAGNFSEPGINVLFDNFIVVNP